jgi:hypothetical protein
MTNRSKLYREIFQSVNSILGKALLTNYVRTAQAIQWKEEIVVLIKNFKKNGHSFKDEERVILEEKIEFIFKGSLPPILYPSLL